MASKTSSRTFTIDPAKPFFIYDTRGEWHATLINGCLWDQRGDYIGFVRGENHDVYTAYGEWVGNLLKDGRVVRKRVQNLRTVVQDRPSRPKERPRLPPRAPLPPLTGDLDFHMIDVLEYDPETFKVVPDKKLDLGDAKA
jgi:hypothetical protein